MRSKETAMPTHEQRMQKKQAVVQERIAAAQEQRGILLINTGNGKGKSSAAFGVLARALGHGLRAAVVQFVKGRSDTGEEAFFRARQRLLARRRRRLHLGNPGSRARRPCRGSRLADRLRASGQSRHRPRHPRRADLRLQVRLAVAHRK
jgi:hypothetical protein